MENTTVKQRLIIFAKSKERSVRAFEKKVGLTIGYINAIRISIQPDKVERITSHYPDLNTTWLLTGKGEMLHNPYLERPNDITSNIIYTSPQFDNESLQRIGIRISEIARLKNTDLKGLAQMTGIDYIELAAIANADRPATDTVIIKISTRFPDINPYWLSTGQSTPFVKDVVPDLDIATLPDKLAVAEKQLHDKDYVISLQKETIKSLKKQVALLEEKTETIKKTDARQGAPAASAIAG